jgi:hypothetical protein
MRQHCFGRGQAHLSVRRGMESGDPALGLSERRRTRARGLQECDVGWEWRWCRRRRSATQALLPSWTALDVSGFIGGLFLPEDCIAVAVQISYHEAAQRKLGEWRREAQHAIS